MIGDKIKKINFNRRKNVAADKELDSKLAEERRAIFDKYWAEAQNRQRSSSENFDKSILTYSSSGLALSLTFLKDFSPSGVAIQVEWLYLSWLCFFFSISLTVVSFWVSYKAQEKSIIFAEEYLINEREEFRNRKTWCDIFVEFSNVISGVTFVAAIISTAIFVKINLDRKIEMSEKRIIANDGMPTALIPKTPNSVGQRGMPTASMPKAPTSKPNGPSATPPTNSVGNPNK